MNYRKMCYKCNRPKNSCLCILIKPITTKTKFITLMHPKEFRKTKNNTGRLTHMSLKNSELFVGIDFSNHKKVNDFINNPNFFSVVLYPSNKSICINDEKLELKGKQLVVFIIDATWDCSKPMLRKSTNLYNLPKISFTHTKVSAYNFKRQPFVNALSTIESTLSVLEILNTQEIENISDIELKSFLKPFEELIKFQNKFTNRARFK